MKAIEVLKQAQAALLAVGNKGAFEKCRELIEREEARAATESTILNTLSTLNTTAPGGLHWDEYAAQEIAKAMALAPTPSARTDELALAAAGEILNVVSDIDASDLSFFTKLKARIQCIVQRAIEAGNQRQPLQDHQIDAITIQQWGKDRSEPLVAHRAYARAIEAAIQGVQK